MSPTFGWFGLRIGVAPAQFFDFVLGFAGIDLVDDDGSEKKRKWDGRQGGIPPPRSR